MFRRKIRLRDQSNTVEISYLSGADVRDDKVSELLVWLFSLNSVATLLLGFFLLKVVKQRCSCMDLLQGINGILADEMGLGKTVQSIALLAHLAEVGGL